MQHFPPQFIIVDGEFTTWEGAYPDWDAPGQFREVIQVGALRFDVDMSVADMPTFESFAKPVCNPVLSNYCKGLTGITQANVDRADSAQQVFRSLQDFIGGRSNVYSYGNDIRAFSETSGLQGFSNPLQPVRWGSIRDTLRVALARELGYTPDWKDYPSGKMHLLLDIQLDGEAHNALHDVRSLAAVLQALHKEGQTALIPELPQRAA